MEISKWYESRKIPTPSRDAFPTLGWLVPNVAAGFLFRDPSCSTAFLENVVSNPMAKALEVHRAIESITNRAVASARKFGITGIHSFTNRAGVARLGLRLGFSIDAWNIVKISRRI